MLPSISHYIEPLLGNSKVCYVRRCFVVRQQPTFGVRVDFVTVPDVELEGIWKEAVVDQSVYCPGICLEGESKPR
jgi:hypothetical protein